MASDPNIVGTGPIQYGTTNASMLAGEGPTEAPVASTFLSGSPVQGSLFTPQQLGAGSAGVQTAELFLSGAPVTPSLDASANEGVLTEEGPEPFLSGNPVTPSTDSSRNLGPFIEPQTAFVF